MLAAMQVNFYGVRLKVDFVHTNSSSPLNVFSLCRDWSVVRPEIRVVNHLPNG